MRTALSAILVVIVVVACGGNPEPAQDQPGGPPCSDGVDNDGDGQADFPDDPGCVGPLDDTEDSPTSPRCSDGRDNDGDGRIDFPDDPGCFAAAADDEADDCPTGPFCPACGNAVDDDGNGQADYPEDPGCTSASDTTELWADPVACGGGLRIEELPPTGIARGALDATSTSMVMSPCGGGAGVPAVAYVFHLSQPTVLVASTDNPATTTDTVLQLRSASCTEASSYVACNDDVADGNERSRLVQSLPPDTYYLIVSGQNAGSLGAFALDVELLAGEGVACSAPGECGPGLVCRTPVNGTQQVCALPVCSDGVDDDGDAMIDYPDDPGCESPIADSEDDDCPSGPGCPACANGVDDDTDQATDYPDDFGCIAASATTEAFCAVEPDFGAVITQPATTGTLAGIADDYDQSCQSSTGNDRAYALLLPVPVVTLEVDTNGSTIGDTVLSLKDVTCTAELACDDDDGDGFLSRLTVADVPAGAYAIQVDAYGTGNDGEFTLNVKGTVAPQTACTSPLFASGVLVCPAGTSCTAGTCQ